MIRINDDLWPNNVGSEFVARIDHWKHLFFSGGVVLLGFIEGTARVVDCSEYFLSSLAKDCPDGVITLIAHDLKGFIPIGNYKHRRRDKLLFQTFKRCQTSVVE